MTTRKLLVLLAFGLLLAACDESEVKPQGDFRPGESFELPYQGEGSCSCGNLSVSFTDVVEDSRCPVNAVCVWEGRAVVQLKLQLPTGNDTILLAAHAGNEAAARDTVGNYRIELLKVSPYPAGSEPIDKERYRIELVVVELE
ncbi:MAG: hypothetical protein J5I94_28230 [Phaeodactylibacter sp.]|nr:hypothetical protein [Phaeodactylibacter sp.]